MAQVSYFYSMKLYDLGIQCALEEAGLLKQALSLEELLPLLRESQALGHDALSTGQYFGKRHVKKKVQRTLFGDPNEERSVRSFLDHPEFQ